MNIQLKSLILKPQLQSKFNVIALHGLLGSKSNFGFLKGSMDSLVHKYYLLDLRNHGESEHLSSTQFSDIAADMKYFIEEHNLKNLCLIGHSYGGRAIFSFLQEYPDFSEERLKGVVIIDIPPKSIVEQMSENKIATLLKNLMSIDMKQRTYKEIVQDVGQVVSNKGNLSFILQNLMLENEDRDSVRKYSNDKLDWRWRLGLDGLLESYQINSEIEFKCQWKGRRALVICGKDSTYIKESNKKDFLNVFPDIDLDKDFNFLENAGHMVHFQKQKEVVKIISQFLIQLQ